MGHPTFTLYSISRWLIEKVIAYVRRHPFFSVSLAVHVVILYFLYSYGSYTVNLLKHQQAHAEVTQSVQKAQQTEMQKRIHDMEKIKRLLEKSTNNTVEDKIDVEKSSAPKSPEALLAKAEEVSAAIKAIEKNIKAEDLAKLLNITKEEAAKKLEEKVAAEKAKKPAQPETYAAAVKRLESEARSALAQRKKELDAKKDGTKVEIATDNPAEKHADENESAHDSSKKGEGESGNGLRGLGKGGDLTAAVPAEKAPAVNHSSQQEMNDFLIDSSYRMAGENNFFDSGMGHIPAVSGRESKQAGRIIGTGGNFAERIYLNSWYVIGPFTGNSHAALYNNPSYPPEQLVDLDAVYFGKDERILKWQYVASDEYPFVPPDRAEDAVYYGYTEVALEQAQDLWMWCGADDDLQVWLNERLVWAGGNIAKQSFFDTIYPNTSGYQKNWNLTEGKRLVHFQQGRNKVLFKLSNGPNRVGIFASIILTK